ncbi:putative tetratricopeptide-like helical domain superfamily [Helianthus debilis subsp. tardiflorus]
MLKSLILKASSTQKNFSVAQFNQQRGLHSRNKMAMEYIAKGWNALKEVDRVINYCEPRDKRLIPHLKTAKDNFEMALEVDNSNTHARYWLSRLHLKYHVPGQCKAIGAALLVEAADMGDADAQMRAFTPIKQLFVIWKKQPTRYLTSATSEPHQRHLQPGALYLLGAVYLTGDCVKKDIASALWCFHRASEKGHAGAAIACGSLLIRGYELPTSVTKFNLENRRPSRKLKKEPGEPKCNPIQLAREQFENAAKLGNDLGFRWLKRLDDEEKRFLAT